MKYFKRETDSLCDGIYDEYIAVPEELQGVFLLDEQDAAWEPCLRSDIDEREDIEVYEYDFTEVDDSVSGVCADLAKQYEVFIDDWAHTGEDPRRHGCSINWRDYSGDYTEIKPQYPERQYIDDKFDDEHKERQRINETKRRLKKFLDW